jgi:hypothetical protein
MRVRELFTGYRWSCVNAPTAFDLPLVDSDSKTDGPAIRYAIGCEAQKLFMAGDYERLDSLMNQ